MFFFTLIPIDRVIFYIIVKCVFYLKSISSKYFKDYKKSLYAIFTLRLVAQPDNNRLHQSVQQHSSSNTVNEMLPKPSVNQPKPQIIRQSELVSTGTSPVHEGRNCH